MNQEQLIGKFRELHEKLVSLVNKIQIEDREKVLFDRWSLKDILAHLIAWNNLDTNHILSLQKGQVFDWVEDWDEFNELEVAKRKSLTWDEIYKDFVASGERLVNAYRFLDKEKWKKEFGRNNNVTAIKDLQGMIDHLASHIKQLENYLG